MLETQAMQGTAPSWEPQRRPDGNVEISVNYFDDKTGRMALGCVSLVEYLRLWRENRLKFQHLGVEKPEHLPTPEAIAEFMAHERGNIPASRPFSPAADRMILGYTNKFQPRQNKRKETSMPEESLDDGGVHNATADAGDCAVDAGVEPVEAVVSDNEVEDTIPETADDQDDQAEEREDTSPDDDNKSTEPPSLESAIQGIATLSDEQYELLRSALSLKRGDGRKELMKTLGVSVFTLTNRLNTVYKKVGVPLFSGRKKFLQHALNEYERRRTSKGNVQRMSEAPPVQEETEDPLIALAQLIGGTAQAPMPHQRQIPAHPSMIHGASGHGTLMIHLPPGVKQVTIKFD